MYGPIANLPGYNPGDPFYRSYLDGGISGNPTGEPAYHIREIEPSFTYQNFSQGSSGWAYAATNIGKVAAVTPRVAIFGHGINDLGETWTDTAARMATCKAGLPSGTLMMVREMTPDNAAATGAVKARNDLTAAWCAANGAVLISCHDAMAQIRTGTSLLEDLKAAYDAGDGIHHNLAGKQKMAELIHAALDSYEWSA